jgi:hypothetical protein
MSNALSILVWVLAAALLVLYVYSAAVATWHLRRTSYLTRSQRLAQLIIVWCVPIIGVAFVLHMLGPEVRRRRPGWVPLLEPLVLAAFLLSASSGEESTNEGASQDSGSPDGSGDGSGD